MRAKYKLLLIFLFFSGTAFSQVAEWSTPQKPKNKTAYIQILGSNDEGYFLHRSASKTFSKKPYIEYYRTSLGLEYSQPLPMVLKKSQLEKVILWGNYLYGFYSRTEARTDRTSLYVQKFDMELNPKGPVVKITETTSPVVAGSFRILHSRDKTKIWCYHTETVGGKQTIYYTQLAEDMTPKLSGNIEMSGEPAETKIETVLADDLGNLFFLTNSIVKDKNGDETKTRFTLIMSNPEKKIHLHFPVDSSENRINSAGIAINYLQRELAVTGIYSATAPRSADGSRTPAPSDAGNNSNGKATGYMFSRYNIDSFSMVSSTFQKFEKEFVTENIGEQAAEKGRQLSDIIVRKIIPRSDAGVILITENFYLTQQSYSYVNNGIPQTQVRNQYNYDNIHVISVNPDGTQEWKHVIKKNQVSLSDEDYYSSFVTMVTPDSIHVLFNEKTSGGDVLHYSIHNTGNIDHEILFKSVNTYVFLMPGEAKQISNNVLMLATIKDRKFCLLKLIF
jgi:hypothetical protein